MLAKRKAGVGSPAPLLLSRTAYCHGRYLPWANLPCQQRTRWNRTTELDFGYNAKTNSEVLRLMPMLCMHTYLPTMPCESIIRTHDSHPKRRHTYLVLGKGQSTRNQQQLGDKIDHTENNTGLSTGYSTVPASTTVPTYLRYPLN